MDFITVPNYGLGENKHYPETININHIISFYHGRISLINGEWIDITEEVYNQIKEYLTKKGHNITKIGD